MIERDDAGAAIMGIPQGDEDGSQQRRDHATKPKPNRAGLAK
jgi:hypothetical protein